MRTYTATARIAITNRGNFANTGERAIKLVQTVYIVGFVALGTMRTSSTTRNLPKPPTGERTAAMSPPMLLFGPNPACHEGTTYAPAANTAPRPCIGTCTIASEFTLEKHLQGGIHISQHDPGICIPEYFPAKQHCFRTRNPCCRICAKLTKIRLLYGTRRSRKS